MPSHQYPLGRRLLRPGLSRRRDLQRLLNLAKI
jgi:hypothetical protein